MLRPVTRAFLVLALCLAVGGNWLALQPVAWASMLVQYSTRAPLAQAFARTFDGQHPCSLCKGINAAQHPQKKSNASPRGLKLDLICATRSIAFLPRAINSFFFSPAMSASARSDSPPTPPPRFELV